MNERELFITALQLECDAKRDTFLDEACAGDSALRQRVAALMKAFGQAGSFLQQPDPAVTLIQQLLEKPGTQIGPYKLLEQIGSGGMGVVYRAEQKVPVRRMVALKVIKPGMDTQQVVARFEAERQALAIMNHPNIAKVLDAGATDAGRPYFVMDLVKGAPLTDFCDQQKLDTRERLQLFITVCQAIQHAHQKGVIHRDIKPGNVLVEMHDVRPVPKVIDFGVAKAIGQQLTEKTLHTGFGEMVGTPAYMSPEQAGHSSIDVDTRSDIYSLGVLLYELLTGHTPFERDTLRNAGFDEMRRMIREVDPPRPSTRVSTLEAKALSTVSDCRRVEPRRLSQQLRGELDWIVMKALEKDRNRRYESANSFASDIQRYLADEPVQACPQSAVYRLRKFVRRRKTALFASSALAIGLLLAVAAVGGSIGFVLRDRAAHETAIAQAASLALDEADAFEQQAKWPDALAAAQRAKALMDSQGGDPALQARVQQRRDDLVMVLRLEEIRLEMVVVKDNTFDWSLGDSFYAKAFRDYGIDVTSGPPEEVARQLPVGPVRIELVAALDHWAQLSRSTTKPGNDQGWRRLLDVASAADADPWRNRLREAHKVRGLKFLRELQSSIKPDEYLQPSDILLLTWIIVSPEVWDVMCEAQRRRPSDFWLNYVLGHHFAQQNPPQLNEALGYYRAALALRPQSPGVLTNLGIVLSDMNRLDEAIAAHEQAIRIKPDYALAHNNLGKAYADKGAPDDAMVAFRKAISLSPDDATVHYNLGTALFNSGAPGEAIVELREAIRLTPSNAAAHNNLGNALKEKGALDEAEDAYRTAIRLKPDHALAYNGLGGLLCDDRGDYDGAITAFRRAIELQPDDAVFHQNLGNALSEKGALDEAITAYRQAALRSAEDAGILNSLGKSLTTKGALDEAKTVLQKAIQLQPDLADAHNNLGNTLTAKGALDEAITAYQKATRIQPDDFKAYINLCIAFARKEAWDETITAATEAIRCKPDFAEAHCYLGHALREKGRLREALEALRRGHELGSKNPRWSYPSALWVEDCQRLIESECRLRTQGRAASEPAIASSKLRNRVPTR